MAPDAIILIKIKKEKFSLSKKKTGTRWIQA